MIHPVPTTKVVKGDRLGKDSYRIDLCRVLLLLREFLVAFVVDYGLDKALLGQARDPMVEISKFEALDAESQKVQVYVIGGFQLWDQIIDRQHFFHDDSALEERLFQRAQDEALS